jgi:hypothetical protein
MSTWRLSSLARNIVGWQIACAVIGLAASLIPTLPKTHPFWGCNYLWMSFPLMQFTIDDVLPDSPASAAGLRDRDHVLSIDGQPIVDVSMWNQMEERLQPGQEARLRVDRFAEETVTLTVKGSKPQREAIVYYDWQIVFAGGCAVFIVLLAATQPLRRLPYLWRPILLILSGLAAIAVLLFTDWQSPGAYELFQRRWPVDNLPYPGIQFTVCLGVAVLEVGLGTWEIRRMIQERQREAQQKA